MKPQHYAGVSTSTAILAMQTQEYQPETAAVLE
jgi:hypothetical protein